MKPHTIGVRGTRRPAFDTLRPRRLPAPTMENWSWQLQGSCLGCPSEVFFPDGKRGHPLKRLEDRAKEICRDCPVLSTCRNYALTAPEMHGVWGAMTALERARLLTRIRNI
jgi:WhiB family redox-sensing transcriptional regulator